MNETKSRKKHGHKYCGFSYEKRHFQVRKIENWFSERLPHMGDKKKLVARISKSEPLILKSKPLIFHLVKTARLVPETNGPSGAYPFVCAPRKCGQNAGTTASRGNEWGYARQPPL